MTNAKFQHKAEFVASHRRFKDGLEAMLLAARDGVALYRVQFMHGGRLQDNITVRSVESFGEAFEKVGAA